MERLCRRNKFVVSALAACLAAGLLTGCESTITCSCGPKNFPLPAQLPVFAPRDLQNGFDQNSEDLIAQRS